MQSPKRCTGDTALPGCVRVLAVQIEGMTADIHRVVFHMQTSATQSDIVPGTTPYLIAARAVTKAPEVPEAPNLSRVTLPGDGLHQGVAWPIRRPSAWLHPPPFSPLLSRGPLQQPA